MTLDPQRNDEQINPGDRVMVVWGCCSEQRGWIGGTSVVDRIVPNRCVCLKCGYVYDGVIAEFGKPFRGWPVQWLRKMPGDENFKSETTRRDVVRSADVER